ncbi:MAG: stage 0 sporulation family protein [Anaerolineae bacterium]|nr:stage 0 sporulation family protein [Anaerolineae bacterium]
MSTEPNEQEQDDQATPLVGVQFQAGGKIYSFSPGEEEDLQPNDFVIVETAWGQQIGQVIYVQQAAVEKQRKDIKPIIRRATGSDLALHQYWQDKAESALEKARELAEQRSLPVKFAAAEYTFDGKRLTIFCESESKEGLMDIQRKLGRSLRTRVELRQVGPRDRAKLLGGYGACGEPRCCVRFLSDFSPVSIRMAKAQGISLTPSEITGMCGRLRCCLVYEHKMYVEASKDLPKRKTQVRTPHGTGKVVDLLPLKGTVIVQIEDRRVELAPEEIQVLPKKS